jgi:hypothetical protein
MSRMRINLKKKWTSTPKVWFAWYPVYLQDTCQIAWLEKVNVWVSMSGKTEYYSKNT